MSAPIERDGLLTEGEAAEWRIVFANLIADGMSVGFACAQADEAIRQARRKAHGCARSAAPPPPTAADER